MNGPFPIHRTEEGMVKHARYLLKRHFRQELKGFKFMLTVVAVITIIAMGYKFQDPQRELPAFLFILAIWAWMSLAFFFIREIINYNRAKWRARRTVKEYMEFAPPNSFCYDDEKIQYFTGGQSVDHAWSNFTGRMEHEDCLYLTPNKKILESLYFSRTEIGDDAYEQLRSIVLRKIP